MASRDHVYLKIYEDITDTDIRFTWQCAWWVIVI